MKKYVSVTFVFLALLGSVCSASSGSADMGGSGGTVTITDMLGRKVTMPKTIHRILALHPIPTGLLAILVPQELVSVDSVFIGRSQNIRESRTQEPGNQGPITHAPRTQASGTRESLFSPEVSNRIDNLPVTGVYFMHPSTEQIVSLRPDVVITLVGDTNIDEEQQQTGIPYFAVSKAPTSDYETSIRLIGQIVGQKKRADEMADFWAKTIRSVQDRAAKAPYHPTVLYTRGIGNTISAPGRKTVFGSTLNIAGGINLGDQLPPALSSSESSSVTLEQVLAWNPDVIIVSGSAAKEKIMSDPLWSPLKAVQTGRVYATRPYASLDGLEALLGLVWVQGVLLDGDSAAAESHLISVMQAYYKLFYGHTLTAEQLARPAR